MRRARDLDQARIGYGLCQIAGCLGRRQFVALPGDDQCRQPDGGEFSALIDVAQNRQPRAQSFLVRLAATEQLCAQCAQQPALMLAAPQLQRDETAQGRGMILFQLGGKFLQYLARHPARPILAR